MESLRQPTPGPASWLAQAAPKAPPPPRGDASVELEWVRSRRSRWSVHLNPLASRIRQLKGLVTKFSYRRFSRLACSSRLQLAQGAASSELESLTFGQTGENKTEAGLCSCLMWKCHLVPAKLPQLAATVWPAKLKDCSGLLELSQIERKIAFRLLFCFFLPSFTRSAGQRWWN